MMTETSSNQWRSAIYTGHVRHRRFVPVQHAFKYPLFMLALDLDELPSLMASKWYMGTSVFHPVRFKRADFFEGDHEDLKQAVIHRVKADFQQQGLAQPSIHRVMLLTHLRYFNLIFNPVSFYYCYDDQDRLVAIQAEITNTPWKERHSYVLPVEFTPLAADRSASTMKIEHQNLGRNAQQPKHEFRFAKHFHVSPFNPMDMDYRWVFSEPNESLLVHMDNTVSEPSIDSTESAKPSSSTEVKHFDATLVMEKRSIQQELGATLIRQPLMTVKVVVGIYWQALKLYVKRSPFYSHPNET